MTETLSVTYMKCAFCTAKNHCESCGAELSEALEQKGGVTAAYFNLPEKTARIDHTLDPDDLEEILEDMSVLVG